MYTITPYEIKFKKKSFTQHALIQTSSKHHRTQHDDRMVFRGLTLPQHVSPRLSRQSLCFGFEFLFARALPAERERGSKNVRAMLVRKKGFAPTTTLFLRLLRRKRRDVESLPACLLVSSIHSGVESRPVKVFYFADELVSLVGFVECCACCLLFRWRLVFCTWDVIVVGLL